MLNLRYVLMKIHISVKSREITEIRTGYYGFQSHKLFIIHKFTKMIEFPIELRNQLY